MHGSYAPVTGLFRSISCLPLFAVRGEAAVRSGFARQRKPSLVFLKSWFKIHPYYILMHLTADFSCNIM